MPKKRAPAEPAPAAPEGGSLRDDLRRLEEIVRALEADDLDLDAALKLFEEGVGRLRAARERLGDAEAKVRKVLEQADGTLSLADLDD